MDSDTCRFRSSRQIEQFGLLGGVLVDWRKGWDWEGLERMVSILTFRRWGRDAVNGGREGVAGDERRSFLLEEEESVSSEVDRDLLWEVRVIGVVVDVPLLSLSMVQALPLPVRALLENSKRGIRIEYEGLVIRNSRGVVVLCTNS